MPQDVFQALDEIDYGFMRGRVEAEFASESGLATASPRVTKLITSARIQPHPDVEALYLPQKSCRG
jgi:hypothetical protein